VGTWEDTSPAVIYVDASFLAPRDGSTDADVKLTLADADVIGAYNMAVDYETTAAGTGILYYTVKYFKTLGLTSGTINKSVDIFVASVTMSGFEVCLVDYSVGDGTTSGTGYTDIDCFLAGEYYGVPVVTSGYRVITTEYVSGKMFTGYKDRNVAMEYWTSVALPGTDDLEVYYRYFPPKNTAINKTTDVSFGSLISMTSGSVRADVDLTFAGWVNYPLYSDIFCTASSVNYIDSDLTVISGGMDYYPFDVSSGAVVSGTIISDVYCCLLDYASIDHELTVISGTIDKLDFDLWCGLDLFSALSFDIDLLSVKISNFQPAEGEYNFSSDGISVDLTDDIYNVLTVSGTHLKVDGSLVSTTFYGITDGYRMYYNPVGGFGNLDGSTEFLVSAENSNGDILTRSYYLTSGYFVDYENYDKIDYGYEKEIVVRMSAENLATCPKFSADAYWFVSAHLKPKDLGASIVGVLPSVRSDTKDLPGTIRPQSTAYFYNKTFRVVLTCKDFLGNEMEPYEFEFKIGGPPN
jgi:hypothetical protein